LKRHSNCNSKILHYNRINTFSEIHGGYISDGGIVGCRTYLLVKLSPTFTSGKMKLMFQTSGDCGHELGSILEKSASDEEVIEIKDILARYNTYRVGTGGGHL
jgi:hypothetical protein